MKKNIQKITMDIQNKWDDNKNSTLISHTAAIVTQWHQFTLVQKLGGGLYITTSICTCIYNTEINMKTHGSLFYILFPNCHISLQICAQWLYQRISDWQSFTKNFKSLVLPSIYFLIKWVTISSLTFTYNSDNPWVMNRVPWLKPTTNTTHKFHFLLCDLVVLLFTWF